MAQRNLAQPDAAAAARAQPPRAMAQGDRFYTLARWAVTLLLLLIVSLLIGRPLWPPTLGEPLQVLVYAYALFSLLATCALFVQPLRPLLSWAFAIDIVLVTLLTFFDTSGKAIFYPLYLLPLVNAVFRTRSAAGLLTGLAAGAAHFLAVVLGQHMLDQPSTVGPVDLIGLGLQSFGLVFVPWVTGGLAERWSSNNRRSVEAAEIKRLQSLDEASAYRDQMRALYEVAYTLSTTANYQNVLDVALTESRKLVPHRASMVLLSSGEPDTLAVAASYNLSEADRASKLVMARGALGRTLRSPDPLILTGLDNEPEAAGIAALRRAASACVIPLRSGLTAYGLMIVTGDSEDEFDQEQLGKLAALASYALVALQNAQLIYDLQSERNKLLSKEEEVRRQLARDLHDGPAQAVAAITMNIEFIKKLIERDPKRVLPELDKLTQLAKRTTHDIRTMLFELRPLALETQGLDVTLRQYIERFAGESTSVLLESAPLAVPLDGKAEGMVFNIIQESVNNALKHAKAAHIWIRLRETETTFEAEIQDDGRGFDLPKVRASYDQRGSFGLLNIEERASLVGGVAELESEPGRGTRVKVIVPLP